jgi:putative alpha-1,2-mannosidase
MPLTRLVGVNVLDNLTNTQPWIGDNIAIVSYYRTHLQDGAVAEISASQHAGIMQYTYPTSSSGKYVLVDFSHYLPANNDNIPVQVQIVSPVNLLPLVGRFSFAVMRGLTLIKTVACTMAMGVWRGDGMKVQEHRLPISSSVDS